MSGLRDADTESVTQKEKEFEDCMILKLQMLDVVDERVEES